MRARSVAAFVLFVGCRPTEEPVAVPVAMEKAPPEGTRMAPGAELRKIQKSHPMAARLRELLEQEGRGSRPVPLRGYAVQETAGRFGEAPFSASACSRISSKSRACSTSTETARQ